MEFSLWTWMIWGENPLFLETPIWLWILFCPFSHNHGAVENHPKWKETNIGGIHFPLPWLWKVNVFLFISHYEMGGNNSWIKHSMKGWNFHHSIKHLPYVPIGEKKPSLKLTVLTWKWMLGIRLFPFCANGIFSGAIALSFKKCASWNLKNHVLFHLIYPGWLGKKFRPQLDHQTRLFFISHAHSCRSLTRRFFIIHQRL